jgi:hypothetical protein
MLARARVSGAIAMRFYELDTIAVNVMFVQSGRFEHRRDLWHPHSRSSAKRFQIADFMYSRRASMEQEELVVATDVPA